MASLETSAWSIAFRACLEPLVAKALGRGWVLVVRTDRGTVTAQSESAQINVVLPRGFNALSPLWGAQRVAEQLRQQALEAGLIVTAGNQLVADLAVKKNAGQSIGGSGSQ